MDVVSDVTHQWNGNWLSGHWTMADDPPRVLNVFKCVNSGDRRNGLYILMVTTRVWTSGHRNRSAIIEEFIDLDPLTAQSIVYEVLEKYSDAPIRDGVRSVDGRGILGVVLDKS